MEQTGTKIALLNHIGSGNLGDDATLDVVMHNIKRRWPCAAITAFSMSPDDTRERHGIACYPIRTKTWNFGYKPARSSATFKQTVKSLASKHRALFWLPKAMYAFAVRLPREVGRELSFLVASHRVIRSFDLLVISGGGQLTEWGGPWGFPYTLLKWVLLAKSARVKCIFLNVGAGPLRHWLTKLFVTRALRLANYISFRDNQSQTLAREIGFTGECQVLPDSAYSLEVSAGDLSFAEKRGQSIVGIAPMPYRDPRVYPEKTNQAVYDDFIRRFAIFASGLARDSYSLVLFGSDIGVDPLAIADLQIALRDHHGVAASQFTSVKSVQELLATMSAMDYVVTCRFHGVVFAHLLNKPVLAISHHPKVTTLMKDIGLSEYCVDIETFNPYLLVDTFASLVSNTNEIKSRMSSTAMSYKAQLANQFDRLFPDLGTCGRGERVSVPCLSSTTPKGCEANVPWQRISNTTDEQ